MRRTRCNPMTGSPRMLGYFQTNFSRSGDKLFPPESRKSLRSFTSGEAAKLIGVSDSHLRQISSEGFRPLPQVSLTGRRSYSLAQINELRRNLAEARPRDARNLSPHRRGAEGLQTIACVNFKGGS